MKLTLRHQLLAAFCVLAGLSILIGLAGFAGTRNLAGVFGEYRETSSQSLVVNQAKLDLTLARMAALKWRTVGSEESAAEVEAALDRLGGELAHAGLEEAGGQAEDYRAAFLAAVGAQQAGDGAVDTMAAAGRAARQALSDVVASAYRDGDTAAAFYGASAQEHLLLARLYAERFLVTNEAGVAERARAETDAAAQALATLRPLLQDATRLQLIEQTRASLEQFAGAFEAAFDAIVERNGHFARMDEIGPEISAAADEVRSGIVARQNELGPRADRQVATTQLIVLVAVLIGAAIAIVMGWVFSARISGAIRRSVGEMTALAEGDSDLEVSGLERGDEIGDMARALAVFRDNAREMERVRTEQAQAKAREEERRREDMVRMADRFENEIGSVIKALAAASEQLQQNARELAQSVEASDMRSSSVAAASTQASSAVEAVASAAEELTASIQEVATQVSASANAARASTQQAQASTRELDRLNEAVAGVDEIIRSISDVAEQTNLLALNATIEAARAGDAGKGFAVVASEVKTLANQTQKLTSEIDERLKRIGASASDAIAATRKIIEQITEIDSTSAALAAAVEEQTSATGEISGAAQQAAMGARTVSADIDEVKTSVSRSAHVAETVGEAAERLKAHSDSLQTGVREFLATVRAA